MRNPVSSAEKISTGPAVSRVWLFRNSIVFCCWCGGGDGVFVVVVVVVVVVVMLLLIMLLFYYNFNFMKQ